MDGVARKRNRSKCCAQAHGKFDAGWRASRRRPSSKTAGEGSGPLNGPPAQMVNRFSHRGTPRGAKVTVEEVKRTLVKCASLVIFAVERRDEWHSTWKTRRRSLRKWPRLRRKPNRSWPPSTAGYRSDR